MCQPVARDDRNGVMEPDAGEGGRQTLWFRSGAGGRGADARSWERRGECEALDERRAEGREVISGRVR